MPTTITADPLTSLTNCKNTFGIALSDKSEDALLNLVISQISALVTEFTNRPFFLASNAANPLTAFLSGDGTPIAFLPFYPIQSVVSVFEDDTGYYGQGTNAFAPDTQLTAGSDYVLKIDGADGSSKSGILIRIGDVWNTSYQVDGGMLSAYPSPTGGTGNIKVTYTYGYQSLPPDLEMAVIRLIAKIRRTAAWGAALTSESYEEYSYTVAADPEVKMGLLGGDTGIVFARYRIAPVPIVL